MDPLPLFASSFAVGLSGAMSPGPLLVVTVAETVRGGILAPAFLMAGHALLELAMAAGLLLGLDRLRALPGFEAGLGIAGGMVMVLLAAGMIRTLGSARLPLPRRGAKTGGLRWRQAARLMGLGAVVSVMNPFWTVWWLTVGASFMAGAGGMDAAKASAFYLGHILSDVAWYMLVGFVIVETRTFLTPRIYRAVLGLLAIVLGIFGLVFLRHGLGALG